MSYFTKWCNCCSDKLLPQDWWRVLVVMVAMGLTVLEVYREVMDILRSRKKLKDRQQWCEKRLKEDLAHTHPMWPEVLYTPLTLQGKERFWWLLDRTIILDYFLNYYVLFYPKGASLFRKTNPGHLHFEGELFARHLVGLFVLLNTNIVSVTQGL